MESILAVKASPTSISIKTGVRPDSDGKSGSALLVVPDLKTGVRPDGLRREHSSNN